MPKCCAILGCFSAIMLAAGVLLAHFGAIPSMWGLGLYCCGGLLGLVAFLATGVLLLRGRAGRRGKYGLAGVLPAALLLYSLASALQYPAINDITTDAADPPAFVHAAEVPANRGRDMGFPAENAGAIREAYPDLAALELDAAPEDVHERIRAYVARQPGWTVLYANAGSGVIEGIARTRLFRWCDDFVVRVRPKGDGGCRVDIRSKSREGKSDLGANARRIRRLLVALRG